MELSSMQSRLSAIEDCLRDIHHLLTQQRSTEMNVNESKDIISIDECSKLTGLSKSTIYKHTSERLIPHYKTGKRLVFKRQDILKWLTTNRRKTLSEIENEANQVANNSLTEKIKSL
jgi:excisionase family DNA binding protein